jgi:hypothetical protein
MAAKNLHSPLSAASKPIDMKSEFFLRIKDRPAPLTVFIRVVEGL